MRQGGQEKCCQSYVTRQPEHNALEQPLRYPAPCPRPPSGSAQVRMASTVSLICCAAVPSAAGGGVASVGVGLALPAALGS